MAVWRMAFRDYTDGPSFWLQCQQRGVATITYNAVADIDFSQHPTDQPTPGWAGLQPAEKGCLRHFVRGMAAGDLIYVKEGPLIVGRGIVISNYQFNAADPIVVPGVHAPIAISVEYAGVLSSKRYRSKSVSHRLQRFWN
jgi:hypothetical protein